MDTNNNGDRAAVQQYRVGDLRVDFERYTVLRGSEAIPLPRLSFDLLAALVRAAPKVLTTEEIMDQVWPGLVVGPETLSQRVKLLRDALGDDSKQPRYLTVVRGRGYQCVAPVATIVHNEPVATSEPITAAPAPRITRYVRIAAAACLALAAVGAIGWQLFDDRTPAAPKKPEHPSIAVLPFENLSTTPDSGLLAFGIAESVLHQLANLNRLSVIARTSSFAVKSHDMDVRAIGKELNVGYVLEGSVQHDGERLRITSQLIDAKTGQHLWSLQFNRSPKDVFAVEDEIARRVAEALDVSVDDSGRQRMTGQGTSNVEAYLAYIDGGQEMSTWHVEDARKAERQFANAIRLDPNFAKSYVQLARARVRLAEFEQSADRQQRFEQAVKDAFPLVAKALSLDPNLGEAYFERARLTGYKDPTAAIKDYQRGLELTPSDSRGYHELAGVLWQNRARRAESAAYLDRARQLDPLEPEYDVTKAVYLLNGPGDVDGSLRLLQSVLERDPDYVPALARLGVTMALSTERTAEGIVYLEQALAADPDNKWVRRMLMDAYLLLGDRAAVWSLVQGSNRLDLDRLYGEYLDRQWQRAADIGFVAVAERSSAGEDDALIVGALRVSLRQTGRKSETRAALESLADIGWDKNGRPLIGVAPGAWADVIGLADVLIDSGDKAAGQALIAEARREMDVEQKTLGPRKRWQLRARAMADALTGNVDASRRELEEYCEFGLECLFDLEWDPAYKDLRNDPRFVSLTARMHALQSRERQRLDALRASGQVPRREIQGSSRKLQ